MAEKSVSIFMDRGYKFYVGGAFAEGMMVERYGEEIEVQRATNIEFNNTTKKWEARLAFGSKELISERKLRSQCLEDEAQYLKQKLREEGFDFIKHLFAEEPELETQHA